MIDFSQTTFAIGRKGVAGVSLLGTGFAVTPSKLATAFHVVNPTDKNLVILFPRTSQLSEYQDVSDTAVNPIPVTISEVDPLRDICILELPESIEVAFSYILGNSDSVPPGSPVTTLGFPHANSGRLVLTQQKAHVGARILVPSSGEKSKQIVLNTQAREGQSGGPVFNADHPEVVALLLGSYAPGGGGQISLGGVDPATLHQTTHAISAEYIQEML